MKLTKRICDMAIYPEEKGSKGFHAVWDGELKGFGIRVNPTGKKTFIMKYRIGGKQGILSIGEYGKITVDEARVIAKERFADIVKGIDPNEEKRKALRVITIADIVKRYLEYSKEHKKSFQDDIWKANKYIIPNLGKRQIETITKHDIKALYDKIAKVHIYAANRTHALLSSMFTYGIKNDLIDERFGNPCKWVTKQKETSRSRFMTRDEWIRIEAALKEETDIYAVAAIRFDILTGLRKSELFGLKWSSVHLEEEGKEYLFLPDTKAGRSFDVPLSEKAVELLKTIPRLKGNDHVFPSPQIQGDHTKDIRRVWNRVRRKAGLQDVHFHDIRRTFGSWLAADHVSLHMIAKLLNQTTAQVTEIYARFQRDAGRELLNKHGDKVISFTDIQEEQKIKTA